MRGTLAAQCAAIALGAALVWACAIHPGPPMRGEASNRSPGCGLAPPVVPGRSGHISLRAGGLEREVILHLPSAYDPGQPIPLVVHFHGYTGAAARRSGSASSTPSA
jgi:poly(3-hydroxybutyrate) depolymerase